MKKRTFGKKRKNKLQFSSIYLPGKEFNERMDDLKVATWQERQVSSAAKRLYDVLNKLHMKECWELDREMKYNKSPFSQAFYKVYWVDTLNNFKLDYNMLEKDF